MLEMRHYALIAALARTGTLSAAARELGYSQPAVSQQLRQLERRVRTPAVVRSGRRSRLTEAGQILARHAEQILAADERARAEVELVAGLRGGELRLAAFGSASATLVPLALAELRQRHPDLTVRLVEAGTAPAIEHLRTGRVDVALVGQFHLPGAPYPALEPDWVWRPIMDEHVYVALHRDHPHSADRVVAAADLAKDRWIAGCEECRANLTEVAEQAGFVPDVALDTDDYVALQRLAALGLGVALIPELMITAARVDPSLVFRLLSPARLRQVSVVMTPTVLRVPGVAQLADCLHWAADQIHDDVGAA